MKSQNQATKVKLNKQNQRSAGPAVVAEPAGDLAALFELPRGPIAAAGNGSIEAQANWLGKGRSTARPGSSNWARAGQSAFG